MGKFHSESRSRRASSRSQHERFISSHLFACNTSVLPDTHLQPSRFRRQQAENIPQHEDSVNKNPLPVNASTSAAFLIVSLVQLSVLLKAPFSHLPLAFWPNVFAFMCQDPHFYFFYFLSFCILLLLRCFVPRAVHSFPSNNI